MNSSSRRLRSLAVGVGLLGVVGTIPPTSAAVADRGAAAVDDAAVSRARAGVAAFITNNAPSIETGIIAPCPLMSPDQLGWFMGQQRLAPTLDGWAVGLFAYEGVGPGAPGLWCGIDITAFVNAAGGGALHAVRLEALAVPEGVDLGQLLGVVEGGRIVGPAGDDIGGEIGGTCFPGDVALCVLLWYRSGLAFTTALAGPAESVTERETIDLMTSMIPTMIQGLARYSDDVGPPLDETPTTTSEPAPTTVPPLPLDVPAARGTLAEFVAATPIGTSGPVADGGLTCPSSTGTGIADAMATAGLPADVDPFLVAVAESAVAPGRAAVTCGGNVMEALGQAAVGALPTYTPALTVYDITDVATVDDVLAERPGLVVLEADVPAIGGSLFGSACDVAAGSGTFCVRVWHREGLVVMFEVAGNARADFDRAATQVITALVPAVVDNLAHRTTWPPPAGLR